MNTARPNILVLMTDQQRFDAMGCAGNSRIHTPNLDRLAARGVYFRNACTPTPICVAARYSFLTGHRLSVHRWSHNQAIERPVPELPTIMTQLGVAGYHTQGVGKMHFRGRYHGFFDLKSLEGGVRYRIDDDYLMYLKSQGVRTRYPRGLRDLLYYQPQTTGLPANHSTTAWTTRESVSFLHEHTRNRPGMPFFLWTSWIAPHPPFCPSEPYDTMYDPAKMDLPVNRERPLATIPSTGGRARLDGAHLDDDRIRRIRALYYGLVTQVDEGVGEILDALDELGLADNTVIIFTSDHGDMLGDHGCSQKNVPYEASARIPMLLYWPDRTEAGRVCDDLVGLEDFLPTVLDELGLSYAPGAPVLPGKSLLGRDGGGLAEPRDGYMIDYHHGPQRWIACRTAHHKYCWWARGGYRELYDLRDDPGELENVIDRQPELATELHERLRRWEQEYGLGELQPTPAPKPPANEHPGAVIINEQTWPEHLPADERDSVESYAEAFTRAIANEPTLSPDKLSLADYKKKGGHPLNGTPWEDAWNDA